MRIGLMVVVFRARKVGPSAKAWQEAGACFATFHAIVFGEMEH
jgi:hypothetical protein